MNLVIQPFELQAVDLWELRKGEIRKVAIATVLRASTKVSNTWLVQHLGMGHKRPVNRLIGAGKDDAEARRMRRKFTQVLKCAG